MKFLKYIVLTYLIMFGIQYLTTFLLKEYTSYRIVHTNKEIKELYNTSIVDITAISSDESYFALSKEGYLFTIDIGTLSITRKLFLKGLHNPQEVQIISTDTRFEQILVIDKNDKIYTLVHYKYIYDTDINRSDKQAKGTILKVSSRKIISIIPISIWNINSIIDSKLNFYYYNNKSYWNLSSYHDDLPFEKPNSLDYSISKKYSNYGYTITDRSNKKVSIYANGNCYGDIREYYDSTFKLKEIPQTAAFSPSLCWAGNYHIMPSSNYWGSLLIAYKGKKGIEIYDIKNDWATTVLHELNKVSTFILSIPFFPLRFIFGRQ